MKGLFYSVIQVMRHILALELRGRSRTVATSKMEHFVIIVNGFQPVTIITKLFILDVAAVLDPPLELSFVLMRHKKHLTISVLSIINQLITMVSQLLRTKCFRVGSRVLCRRSGC